MGIPISLIVVNLFMEEFETKVMNTAINPPRLWRRYADHTFVIQKAETRAQFLEHINPSNPHIQFTTEDPNTDGSMSFLEILDTSGLENILHSLQETYLHWSVPIFGQPPQPIHKIVFKTLTHKVRHVCSNQMLLQKRNTSSGPF